MTKTTMHCPHSNPLCDDCRIELNAIGSPAMPDIRQQLTDIAIKITGKKYLTKASRQGIAELEALISQTVSSVVGEKEYYHEHYPFVRTQKQQEEAEEKIARDELRVEQLATAKRLLGGGEL